MLKNVPKIKILINILSERSESYVSFKKPSIDGVSQCINLHNL